MLLLPQHTVMVSPSFKYHSKEEAELLDRDQKKATEMILCLEILP